MSKEQWEQFALGHKKGKNCQKHLKNTNFISESLIFCPKIIVKNTLLKMLQYVGKANRSKNRSRLNRAKNGNQNVHEFCVDVKFL